MKKDQNKLYFLILFSAVIFLKCKSAWAFGLELVAERKKTAAAVGLAVLILIGYAARKIYHKLKYGGKGWIGYVVEDNDNILDLALHHGIDWQTLAKTNNIEPPYVLTPGQNILVPPKEMNIDAQVNEILDRKTVPADIKSDTDNQNNSARKIEIPVPDKTNNSHLSDISFSPTGTKEYESEINDKKIALENMFTKQHEFRVNAEMSKKEPKTPQNKMTLILVIIIIVLLAAGGTFYYWKNKNVTVDEVASESEVQPTEANLEKPTEEPKEEPVMEPEEAKPEIKAEQISIKVLNVGSPAGSAGKTKDYLVSKNYLKSEAGNGEAENIKGAIIYYKEENYKKEVENIQSLLEEGQKITAQIKIAETAEEKSGDIVILLGK